jgi:hypothetical protein
MRALASFGCALALLSGSAEAQGNVWVVGGANADFQEIQAAVDAAGEGDVLLIRSKLYAPVTIDGKSLSLIADTGADVRIQQLTDTAPGLCVRNLAEGQSLFARGLEVWGKPALELESLQGNALIEDSVITGSPSIVQFGAGSPVGKGAVVQDSASVAFTRTTLGGGGVWSFFDTAQSPIAGAVALDVEASAVHLYESAVQGGMGSETDGFTGSGGNGGRAVELEGSLAFVGGSTIRGGSGGSNLFFPACDFAGFGGDGIAVSADSQLFFLDSTIQGGSGNCSAEGPGEPIVGHATALPGVGRSMQADSPVREGEVASSTFVGHEGDLVFGLWGVSQQQEFYDFFSGTRVPFPLAVAFIGVIPSTGNLLFSLPLGDLPPGVGSLTLFSQGVVIPVDAPLLLTNATGVVILDEAF